MSYSRNFGNVGGGSRSQTRAESQVRLSDTYRSTLQLGGVADNKDFNTVRSAQRNRDIHHSYLAAYHLDQPSPAFTKSQSVALFHQPATNLTAAVTR